MFKLSSIKKNKKQEMSIKKRISTIYILHMSRNTKQKNERKCPEPDWPAIAWWLFPSVCSFVVLLKRKKLRRSLPNTDAGSDIKHIQSGGIVNVKERLCVMNRE
jgi:hypothetical protein